MTSWADVANDPNARKCLDHGFLVLRDHMGSDQTIVESARVSYGQGTKQVSTDKGLIRYLLRHKHTTPFEMVEFRFLCKMPIFVARQWVRHRTACLTGDNVLNFDLGNNNTGIGHYPMTIENFYNKWHNGSKEKSSKFRYYQDILNKIDLVLDEQTYTIRTLSKLLGVYEARLQSLVSKNKIRSEKVSGKRQIVGKEFKQDLKLVANEEYSYTTPQKRRLEKMRLRSCNEDNGEIYHTNIVDIWSNGLKPIYEVELENGYKIKATKNHRFYTSSGWCTLEEAIGLCVNEKTNEVRFWTTEDNLFAVNGIPAYQDKTWLQDRLNENLNNSDIGYITGCSEHTIRKWIGKLGLKRTKEQLYALCSIPQIGRKKPSKPRGLLSKTALENVRKARSGAASNFWKGGVNSRDNSEDKEWYHARNECFRRNGFKCQASGLSEKIEAHHIEPRYMSPGKKYDVRNLITLNRHYHMFIHTNNLEKEFIAWVTEDKPIPLFFEKFANENQAISLSKKVHYQSRKGKEPHNKLTVIQFSKIKNISYVGEEMTYDLEVSGPYHNFSCNKIIVHNSINEYSGRYSVMSDDFYIPNPEDCAPQSVDNKQGRSGDLTQKESDGIRWLINANNDHAYQTYETLLGDVEDKPNALYDVFSKTDGWFDESYPGLARELSRMVLPLNNYTEWYWKSDLHNILRFLSLRSDPHAQKEIQVYALAMEELITPYIPLTMEAYNDYIKNAKTLSSMEVGAISEALGIVKDVFTDEFLSKKGLSKREIIEFRQKFNL